MATIFALGTGAPPAAIAIVRISGPAAGAALTSLAGKLPLPRRATRARLRDGAGATLDDALVLWFPGPATATGEDLAELHLHGGRAVIAAVEQALAGCPGLRRAEPGEFTRRAFANGRIDLAQAEGLADLLSAETELQRRAAVELAGGALSRKVEQWRERLLQLSAEVEAALDFDEEDSVGEPGAEFGDALQALGREIGDALEAPSAETLREGYRVALAGPPNAGKSTLFNALVEREAAITSPLAGTTRDVIMQTVAIRGVPLTFVDMAGLRAGSPDPIEAIGIARAQSEIERSDLVLWLGATEELPPGGWDIEAQCDRSERVRKPDAQFRLSALTREGLVSLVDAVVHEARTAMPKPGQAALAERQRRCLLGAQEALLECREEDDWLLVGEHLREARAMFDVLLGRTATEDVLDALFGRFCLGK